MNKPGKIFVLSGPSGSGKTTLAAEILKDRGLAKRLRRSISFTTRRSRPNEKHGKDYFFITEAEFLRNRRQKKILEWTRYLGYYYGTAKEFVDSQLRESNSLVLCLDIKGARRIRRLYPRNSVLIFVLPPSIKELERRIRGRCSGTSEAELRKRLARAEEEMAQAGSFDYRLVNRDFQTAAARLIKIVKGHLS